MNATLKDFAWTELDVRERAEAPQSLMAFLLYALFKCVPTEPELEAMRVDRKRYTGEKDMILSLGRGTAACAYLHDPGVA